VEARAFEIAVTTAACLAVSFENGLREIDSIDSGWARHYDGYYASSPNAGAWREGRNLITDDTAASMVDEARSVATTPLWEVTRVRPETPTPTAEPHLWDYETLRELLRRAGPELPVS
jgi:hypothetical protein